MTGAEVEKPASADPRAVRALIALTLIAGMIDGLAFLGLGQVFAANMTGNVIVLGIAIAGAPALSIDGPLVALGAFLIGAGLFARLAPDRPLDRRSPARRLTRMVRIELVVIAAAAATAIGFEIDDDPRGLLLIAALAAAMGVRNETIRRIGVPELPTTVLTWAIAGFAAHEAERVASSGDRLRLAGIITMIAGAVAGALLVLHAGVFWALLAVASVEVIALLILGRGPAEDPVTVER